MTSCYSPDLQSLVPLFKCAAATSATPLLLTQGSVCGENSGLGNWKFHMIIFQTEIQPWDDKAATPVPCSCAMNY